MCAAPLLDCPHAYTDGACRGNPGPGGWGVRILYPDGLVRELGGREAATTNNRMELQGAIQALQLLRTSSQVTLYTDSRYVIDGVTKWLHAWRRRGWVTATNTPVKNQDLWMRLAQENHPGVRWRHVYGHSGDPNNERVDTIARAWADGMPLALFCGQAGAPEDPVGSTWAAPTLSVSTSSTRGSRGSRGSGPVRYISLVRGTVAIDTQWAACEARVRGVPGAHYRKIRTREELAAFCAAHGVEPPPGV